MTKRIKRHSTLLQKAAYRNTFAFFEPVSENVTYLCYFRVSRELTKLYYSV